MNASKRDRDGFTIGLLTFRLDRMSTSVWNGASDAVRDRGGSALCFPGSFVGLDSEQYPAQANVLYQLVGARNVDGLVIWGGSLLENTDARTFCAQYGLPVVNVGSSPEGLLSLTADNYGAMRQVVKHLMEVHGHRRIAFIHGPTHNAAALERYRAYCDVLEEAGIPLDTDLISLGSNQIPDGMEAVRLWLDERRLRPGVDFEAVVASNDNMALGAMKALQGKGIRVPGEVAVVGFDDIEEASAATPSLTTARYSFYELGRQAAEMLLDHMTGQEVEEKASLAIDMVVRRSCGCVDPVIARSAIGLENVDAGVEKRGVVAADVRAQVLLDLVRAVKGVDGDIGREQVGRLLDGFFAEIDGKSMGCFLDTLDDMLQEVAETSGRVMVWQDVISTLQQHLSPFLCGETAARAVDLWVQARVMIGEAARRASDARALQAEWQADLLREVGQTLATTPGVEELAEVLWHELPRLGIPSAYLSLYEDPAEPLAWSRLMLGYDGEKRIDISGVERRFPSQDLAPEGMLPRGRTYSMVVEPLYYLNRQLGFVLLEMGPREGAVYDGLRGEISSALQGALLTEQAARRAVQLHTMAEVSRAAGSELNPEELIQQVVELIKERFDLYYVGLFLVEAGSDVLTDESAAVRPGEQPAWAVLKAGTGEAGQQMVAQGHRLRVGGDSMVGRCVVEGRGQIASAVARDGIECRHSDGNSQTSRFRNLLLPETRSEMALPLISRGKAIGALSIHSSEWRAFGGTEIAIFETMAGQLADAIENARLYQEAENGRRLAEEANRLKSRFLSVVSHELRAPLNMIAGLSQVLLRDGELVDSAQFQVKREDVERIYVTAQHLDGLIRDVLDLARCEVGQLRLAYESVSLREVLDPILIIGQQLAQDKGLTWRVEIPDDLPHIWGDPTRLRQVTLNIVNNAIKFTARGAIKIGVSTEGERVRVSVHDTGLGIPVDEQEVIFDEFRQSERTTARGYGGLGLGLAICKRLVEMHGGEIGVCSSGEEGGGSTFFYTLPTMIPEIALPDSELSLAETRHVLLLARDSRGGALLRDHLMRQGFGVVMHQVDERAGMDWLTWLLAGAPEAVVLDRDVASKQGWEMLKALKGNPATQHVPMLFYTLADDEGSNSIAVDYLTKPVGTRALAEALACKGLLAGERVQERKVLVVDDEAGMLEMNARMVEYLLPDCQVLRARNGHEALEIIGREHPDLVLLDLMMPELDGFGVLEALRGDELSRNTPIIVLTGQVLTEEDMARLNRGVTSVLSKGLFTVEETLGHIETALSHAQKLGAEARQTVRRAMAYIYEHYAEPISRTDVASYVGLSNDHLGRCFRQETGMTLISYLNRYRVHQAKMLLKAGNQSITEIAMAVGFSDSQYFARVFRREVGISPSAYLRGER